MSGKHRRTGIVASGCCWQGTISESARGWFTPYTEPESPAWPKHDHDAEAARAEARRVAATETARSPAVLAEVLNVLQRI
ncbi:hypothetical protein [Saccharopolyspora spinosa]|uniref:hypothetical protein n=1 Tax=Saccharopolyspora spinosa TaxID=60894 RepID=UPI0002DBD4AC|nr:hypothetical protein [Saccharopolyspora spinosa]